MLRITLSQIWIDVSTEEISQAVANDDGHKNDQNNRDILDGHYPHPLFQNLLIELGFLIPTCLDLGMVGSLSLVGILEPLLLVSASQCLGSFAALTACLWTLACHVTLLLSMLFVDH